MGEIFYFDLALRRTVAVSRSMERATIFSLSVERFVALSRAL